MLWGGDGDGAHISAQHCRPSHAAPAVEGVLVVGEVGGGKGRRVLAADVHAEGLSTRVHDRRDRGGGRALAGTCGEECGVKISHDVVIALVQGSASVLYRTDGIVRCIETCADCRRARGGGWWSASGSRKCGERRYFNVDVALHRHSKGLECVVSQTICGTVGHAERTEPNAVSERRRRLIEIMA
jgi:hypothetical protein